MVRAIGLFALGPSMAPGRSHYPSGAHHTILNIRYGQNEIRKRSDHGRYLG